MLAIKLNDGSEGKTLLLVLEPGNLHKLKESEPISKVLNPFFPDLPYKVEIIIGYTPDLAWVIDQLIAGGDLVETLTEGSDRPEVVRPSQRQDELLMKISERGDNAPDSN